MLPLIVRPALMDLLERRRRTARRSTRGSARLFYVPGGRRRHLRAARRLPDRPVRPPARAGLEHPALRASRRSPPASRPRSYQLLFWRCCTFVGVCVEFVAAVAWLAELFPDPKQRETVLGYTQAFGSLGGLHGRPARTTSSSPTRESFPAVHGGHEAWRYTLMSGLIPAIPLIIIRPFLPESPAWQREEGAPARCKRPSFARAVPAAVPRARRSSRRS